MPISGKVSIERTTLTNQSIYLRSADYSHTLITLRQRFIQNSSKYKFVSTCCTRGRTSFGTRNLYEDQPNHNNDVFAGKRWSFCHVHMLVPTHALYGADCRSLRAHPFCNTQVVRTGSRLHKWQHFKTGLTSTASLSTFKQSTSAPDTRICNALNGLVSQSRVFSASRLLDLNLRHCARFCVMKLDSVRCRPVPLTCNSARHL